MKIIQTLDGNELLSNYFKRIWEERFPSHYWDFYFRKEEMKKHSTNNYVESHFAHLKKAVGKNNKIENFIDLLFQFSQTLLPNLKVSDICLLLIFSRY